MRIPFFAALVAATALIPVAANAQNSQDRGGWHGNSNHGGDRADRGGNRNAAPARPAARPAAPARPSFNARRAGERPHVQAPARESGRFDGGRRGDHGFDRPQPVTQRPAAGGANNWRAQAGGQRDRRGNDQRGANRGRNDHNGQWNGDRNGRGGQWNQNRDNRNGQWNRGGQDWRNHGRNDNRQSYNRDWRRDNRYDWRDYRTRNRGAFHLPRYYAPNNSRYGYRRFGIGLTLGSALFGQNYWIADPYMYRLPPAYGPYRWVRYYDDALLVDIRTGYVVDVVYDIFW